MGNLFLDKQSEHTMPFKKIKAKVKKARGAGEDALLATLEENWEDWKGSLAAMDADELEALKEKFEEACTDAGEAITVDSAKEFSSTHKAWSPDDRVEFCKVLAPEYFELAQE